MKVEDIRIGMKLRNPHAGRTGKVTKIEREGGLELVSRGLTWNEHVENVEPVGELHIGDYVRATGKSTTFGENVEGKIGIIDSFMNAADGAMCADIRWLCGSSNLVKISQLTPLDKFRVGDRVRMIGPSASGGIEDIGGNGIIRAIRSSSRWCECVWDSGHINIMPPTSIEHVTKSFDDLFPDDELLIHPAIHIEDFRPLIEVAKCYIQVEPERLLLSQDARRVIEYLTAVDTPIAFYRIAEGLKDMVSGAAIIDGLIEAREAGIVRLDGGKYSIARD